MPKFDRLPTMEIIRVLTKRLDIADPLVTHGLSMDFLFQLDFAKRTAVNWESLGTRAIGRILPRFGTERTRSPGR